MRPRVNCATQETAGMSCKQALYFTALCGAERPDNAARWQLPLQLQFLFPK